MVLLMNFSQLLKEMERNVATKVLASVLLHRLASSNSVAPDMSFPPLGVPADLQSAVKKCPNLFMLWGFAIPSNQALAGISMG